MNNLTPTGSTIAAKCCAKQETLKQRLACLAEAGPGAIDDRLTELDREWTAARVTKVVVGVVIFMGFGLTALFGPWWLILTAFGGALLLQYLFARASWLDRTFQWWSFRSSYEVDQEKIALKVLRGDFQHLPSIYEIENRAEISRLEGEGGIVVEPHQAKVAPLDAAHLALAVTEHHPSPTPG